MKESKVNKGISPLMEILEQCGMNMTAFAKEIGVDTSTVRDWATGRTQHPRLSIPQFKKLVGVLNKAGIPLDSFPDSFPPSNQQTETP